MFGILPLILSALSPFFTQAKTEVPRHNLSPLYAEATDEADRAIAQFMQENCKDREEAIFYIPRTRSIVRVGKDASIGGVIFDSRAMRKALRSEANIIEAHCHIMDMGAIAQVLPELAKVLAQVGPRETRERFWMEVPSSGDMTKAIDLEAKVLARHPLGGMEHRIVVVEPGLPPHVLSYGFAPAAESRFKDLVRKKKYNISALMEYDRVYSHPLYALDNGRC